MPDAPAREFARAALEPPAPVARLRFDPSDHVWSRYWRDRNERFRPHPRQPASPTVQVLLDEIAHDPTAISWAAGDLPAVVG